MQLRQKGLHNPCNLLAKLLFAQFLTGIVLALWGCTDMKARENLTKKHPGMTEETGWSVNANQFQGTDSERIAQAVAAVKEKGGGRIVLSRRMGEEERDYWLLDEAILLDSSMTLVIDDCTVKLSDQCRDNFIRSANCGTGITAVRKCHDLHILGVGKAVLQGADHPRSTGDGAKPIGIPSRNYSHPQGRRSYGTDGGKAGERQKGDWRNIGILLAHVEFFSIRNITIRDSHCWAISHEHCTDGLLTDLHFESTSRKMIDGREEFLLNQDGIDLRMGCHRFTIENITGHTGDDLIALTAIIGTVASGNQGSTMVAGTMPSDDNDISQVTIHNVKGHSAGRCQLIRLLNAKGAKIHDITLDGIIDESTENSQSNCAIKIGDKNPAWGGGTPLGDTYGITIKNVQSHARRCIVIAGSLCDSTITNVIHYNTQTEPIVYESGVENTRNLTLTDIRSR